MASKNVTATELANYRISSSAYVVYGGTFITSAHDYTVYRCGRAKFPSINIGGGTLNSATLYLKVSYVDAEVSREIRFAVDDSATGYTTAIASDYTTKTATLHDNDVVSIDIKSLLNGLSDYNATFYVFGLQMDPDYDGDTERGAQFDGGISPYSGVTPYIAIDYTPSDSQLYIGTASGNKVCDVYIGTAGGNKKVTDIYIGTAGGNKRVEL